MALPRLRTSDGGGTSGIQASRPVSHRGELDHIAFPLNLLIGFAPFAAFIVLSRLSISLALWAAFAGAFALGLPVFLHTRTIRTLDGGGVALFGLSALLSAFLPALSNFNTVRLVVILGMLAIVLTSFLLRQPFAQQYTAEEPDLTRGAGWISGAWTAAFALMTTADAMATYIHGTSERLVLLVNLVALVAAITLTLRLTANLRRARAS